MNDISGKKSLAFTWVDWLLLAAIMGLSCVLLSMIAGPAIEAWRNRPRPGIQARQQYVEQNNSGSNAVAASVDYLIYLPQEYDVSRKWPLVVYLHGAGERGQDLNLVRRLGPPGQVDRGDQFPFILVSPQCPANSSWEPERVVKLIKHISDCFAVDPDRVYLTGCSMGGFGTWATACYDPNLFAAIAPLAGGGDVTQAKRLADLPIWAFHGKNDRAVPLEANETMVNAVRRCGGHVKFTVYPDYGHDICDVTYRDGRLYGWFLGQHNRTH